MNVSIDIAGNFQEPCHAGQAQFVHLRASLVIQALFILSPADGAAALSLLVIGLKGEDGSVRFCFRDVLNKGWLAQLLFCARPKCSDRVVASCIRLCGRSFRARRQVCEQGRGCWALRLYALPIHYIRHGLLCQRLW